MKGAKKIILLLLMLLYMLFLAKIMVLRHYTLNEAWLHILDFRMDNIGKGWEQASFVPLRSSIDYMFYTDVPLAFKTEQVFANLVAFAPLGAISPLLWNRFVSTKNILCLVFFISIGFELFQWIFRFGVFEVDQIMLNMLGCAAGFIPMKILFMLGEKQMAGQKAKI